MSHSPMLYCAQHTHRNVLRDAGICRDNPPRRIRSLTGFEHRALWLILMLAISTTSYGETTKGLTVQEAIQLALDNNPEYQQVLDSIKVSGLDLELARSVFRGRISSTASTQSRLGSELGKNFSLAVSKRLRSGSELEAGFFTSEYTGVSLSELRLRYTRPLFSDPERSGLLSLQKAERESRHAKRLEIVGAEELAAKIIKAYYQALQSKSSVTVPFHHSTINTISQQHSIFIRRNSLNPPVFNRTRHSDYFPTKQFAVEITELFRIGRRDFKMHNSMVNHSNSPRQDVSN